MIKFHLFELNINLLFILLFINYYILIIKITFKGKFYLKLAIIYIFYLENDEI